MKCPMKFADGSCRASQTECEREDCAWWVTEVMEGVRSSACAVAFVAVGESEFPRLMVGEVSESE